MTTPFETLDRTLEVLQNLDAGAAIRGDDDTLLGFTARVEQAGRMIDALRVQTAVEIDKRSDRAYGQNGLSARHGHRTGALLVEQITGTSATTARARIRVGRQACDRVSDTGATLPPLFPAVGAALAAGSLALDAADAITRELTRAAARANPTHLDNAEQTLVDEATGATTGMPLSADLIATQARLWRDALDPDGIEPRADEAFQNRGFWVSRSPKRGVHAVGGNLAPEIAAQWFELASAVMTPKSAPKFRTDGPCGCDNGCDDTAECLGAHLDASADLDASASLDADAMRDDRTIEQQGHDLFATLLTHFARTTDELTLSGGTPTVIVTVRAEDLLRDEGTGRITGITEPVALSTVRQQLCNGAIQRAILGPFGNLVALEHGKRLFTRAQRLGMIARDGTTCLFPSCRIPATACEAHHVTEWSHEQHTSTDNGALVCYAHHRTLERGEWTIDLARGKPRVRPPDWLTRKPYLRI